MGDIKKIDTKRGFKNIAEAINYLQARGYSDYEISLFRFIPKKNEGDAYEKIYLRRIDNGAF